MPTVKQGLYVKEGSAHIAVPFHFTVMFEVNSFFSNFKSSWVLTKSYILVPMPLPHNKNTVFKAKAFMKSIKHQTLLGYGKMCDGLA